jgi:hypothetical protein
MHCCTLPFLVVALTLLLCATVRGGSYGIGDPLFGHRIIVTFDDLFEGAHWPLVLATTTTPALKRHGAQTAPLVCHSGTTSELAQQANNCTLQADQDSCVSFVFNTTLDGASTGATVYTCGNCSLYQALQANYTAQVACCATGDLCLAPVAPPAPPGACGALLSEQQCVTRQDCFWCGNASFGVDLCQALPGSAIDVCWAVPVRVPASVCGYVACAPYPGEPYSVELLTLNYLVAFGFPPVTRLGATRSRAIALDARSRYNQTRTVNQTLNFCTVDDELRSWCGIDTWHAPIYCIVAERWPQPDTWGWIQNTTVTAASTSLSTIFPAFCACPVAGRALYLPGRSVDNKQHYGPDCRIEHVMLAFYVLLMLVTLLLFVWVINDTLTLVAAVWRRKPGKAAHWRERTWVFLCTLAQSKTFWPKMWMWAYFLIAIPDQALFITPPSNTTAATARAVLCFLAVIFLLAAYSWSVFACIEILLEAKVFGTGRDARMLYWYKWFFFVSNGIFLLAAQAMVIVFAVYLKQAQDFAVANLPQLTFLVTTSTALAKAIMLLLLLTQSLVLMETLPLLIIATWYLKGLDHRVKGMKDVVGRVAGLWLAMLCGLPNLGMLAIVTPVISWITTGSILSYWDSAYQTHIAYLWLIFGYYATDQLWLCGIAYAVRTKSTEGWWQTLYARFVIDQETMVGQDTQSGASGTSKASTTMQSTDTGQAFDAADDDQ